MSGLFGGSSNSVQQQVYTGIQVSTSLLGGCIPYVAGRQRVTGNLLWYGDFQVSTSNAGGGKGGGGNSNKQYSYSAAFILGLGIGPIQGVTQVWHDKALVTLSFENLALSEGGAAFIGSISGTTLTITKLLGGLVQIGASLTGPGVTAGTTISSGSGLSWVVNHSQTVASAQLLTSQAVWSGYPSGTPAGQQISYGPVAYVATSAYALGSSAALPNLSFEMEGVVGGYSDVNSIFDADPSAVFPDYLLDPIHGALAGYPGSPLTIGSSAAPLTGTTNSYQAYVMSMGLLTSPYEDTQRQATDFVSELLQCTNSNCRLSVGTLEVIPYADSTVSATVAGTAFSYTPNLTPVYSFTDDDYNPDKDQPPVKLKITPQADTYNTVNVEYVDRSNYYNTAPVNASDLNDIALYGPRLGSTLTWHQITSATVAKTAGQLWLTRQLYEVNTYTFRVRADFALLEPLDLIALNDTNLGLVGQVCQITEIEDDADNLLTITAIELPGVTRTTAQYNWSAAAGFFANYATDPGVVQTPAIFVMPPIPAALSEGITIGIAVAGQSSNAAWLGCDVYCSVDGGSTYQFVGKIPGACRYGTLTAGISAVADPDTTSTLSIQLADTNTQISTAVTHADADSCQTLILVGTGSTAEIMSFGAASLTGAGAYNLSYLRRGLYGSTDQSHSSSAPFMRLDGDIFQIAVDPGYAGKALNFKFVSFNTYSNYGPQTLASSTAYSYTVPAALPVSGVNTLIPRGTCSVSADGTSVYKATGSAAWDSDAYSPQGFLNGCFVSARVAISNKAQMIGLAINPSSTVSYTNINFALFLTDSASALEIFELGSLVGTFGTYAVGDNFEIRYDAVTVRYFQNGALIRAVRAPGLQLFPKVAQNDVGCVLSNIEFGPASAVNQPTGSWLNTYPWVIGATQSQGNYIDIAAGASSQIELAGTSGVPLGPYGVSEPVWVSNAGSGTNDGGWNNSGDLYGIDATKTYRSVVWVYWNGVGTVAEFSHGADEPGAARYTCTVGTQTPVSSPYFNDFTVSGVLAPNKWYLAVGILHGSGYTGSDTGTSGIYDPTTGQRVVSGTEFDILAGAPFQMQRVYHRSDTASGGHLFFAKSRWDEVNGNEPSLQALMQPASAYQGWVETGNTVQSGQAFSKQGGSAAWDSTAYTVNGYATCHIGGKPISTSQQAIFGFSDSPAAANLGGGTAYSTPGHYFEFGSISGTWVWEETGGASGSFGISVQATDLAEMTYDGTTVSYLLNQVVVRTTTAAGLILRGFVVPHDVGSGFNAVSFGPTTNRVVQDTAQLGQNAATNLAYLVDDATYATTFGGTALSTTYPGVTFGVPYVSSPILNFTGAASQTIIMTATGTVYFTNTSPGSVLCLAWMGIAIIDTTNPAANVLVGFSPQAGSSRSFNNINTQSSAATSPTQQFAFQLEETVTIGHTYAVVVFCQTGDVHVTAQTTSVQIQVETIKR